MGQNADDIGKALRWIASHGATLRIESFPPPFLSEHKENGVHVMLHTGEAMIAKTLYPRDGGALCLGTFFALELGQMIKQLERAGAHTGGQS